MKIVIAPDSFKESMTAQEAAKALEREGFIVMISLSKQFFVHWLMGVKGHWRLWFWHYKERKWNMK